MTKKYMSYGLLSILVVGGALAFLEEPLYVIGAIGLIAFMWKLHTWGFID